RDITVDQPHEIADNGRRGGDRSPGIHHDADAERLLAGRPAAVEGLEQREVAPGEAECQEDHDGTDPAAGRSGGEQVAYERAAGHQHPKDPEGLQAEVEQPRRHTRSHTGQLELDVDVLRRLYAVVLPEIEVSRGGRHVLILPRVPSRSDPLTRTSGPCGWARYSTGASISTGVTSACSCG